MACDQNVRSLDEAATPATPVPRPQMAAVDAQPGAPDAITGTITIAPDLSSRLTGSEVLFIMARRGTGGAPLAVKRVNTLQFPMTYTLNSADQMVQGPPFSGEVSVVARIDRDGSAGPPTSGDMEGLVPRAVIGQAGVDIVIDKAY